MKDATHRTAACTLAAAAFLATAGLAAAQTSETPMPHGGAAMPMMDFDEMREMMRERGMGSGATMMDRDGHHDRRGRMGQHGRMGGHGPMLRIMFAVMDADGDGTLQLDEVQEFHARIFRAVDADDDGGLSPAELRAFMSGADPADP